MNSMFKRRDPAQLAEQLKEVKGAGQYNQDDGTEWTLTTDSAGSGNAVIRFLPQKTDDSFPFIKLVNHGFKGKGKKWYINNCTSTHGDFDNCPVCRYISDNDIYKTNNALFSQIKRKTSYWANILVIKDPNKPENEGKVFKYRFGQKIMDKIDAQVQVDLDIGETPVNVFCPFEGANFVLKCRRVGGFANYEDSKFQNPSEIGKINDPEFQKYLEESMHDLEKMKTFEPFDKLEKEFKLVLGTGAAGSDAQDAAEQADQLDNDLQNFEAQMNDFDIDATVTETKAEEKEQKVDPKLSLDDLLEGI